MFYSDFLTLVNNKDFSNDALQLAWICLKYFSVSLANL